MRKADELNMLKHNYLASSRLAEELSRFRLVPLLTSSKPPSMWSWKKSYLLSELPSVLFKL